MKACISCVVLLLCAGVSATQETKAKWVEISPNLGNCKVMFPGTPKEQQDKTGGTQLVLEAQGGKAAFFIQVNPFPQEVAIANAEIAKKIMDGGRDGLLRGLKGSKVLSERGFSFDNKYPARDLDADSPSLGIYRTRFIITPTHFYQIVVGGPRDFVDSADAKKFMESFKITK